MSSVYGLLKPSYLHAKFMIADSNMAYVGSANITSTSLEENIEVGIVFSGERVKQLLDFFNEMWGYSKE